MTGDRAGGEGATRDRVESVTSGHIAKFICPEATIGEISIGRLGGGGVELRWFFLTFIAQRTVQCSRSERRLGWLRLDLLARNQGEVWDGTYPPKWGLA